MNRTIAHIMTLLITVIFSSVTVGLAQEKDKTVKKEPIKYTSPVSGEKMFASYCAVCHGKDAKGGGPAASALKVAPPDLTKLAQQNGGKFPAEHVSTLLRNGISTPVHGTAEMPVWGPLFSAVDNRNQAIVSVRISNLVHYLESLQAK